MKSIFEYKNYLDYLNDYYQEKKSNNPHFSYAVWAAKMNLKSSSMLSMILNNERFPSKALIEKLAKYIGLSKEEEEYMEGLIDLKRIQKNSRLTVFLKSEFSPTRTQEDNEDLLLTPTTFIIKELVEGVGQKGLDPLWLKKHLLIGQQDINLDLILSELLKRKIIAKNDAGKIILGEEKLINILTTPDQVKRFHFAGQELAREAFENSLKETRTFHTSFVRLKMDRLEEAKKKLINFQREFSEFVEDGEGDCFLYQINLQLFPLSKKI